LISRIVYGYFRVEEGFIAGYVILKQEIWQTKWDHLLLVTSIFQELETKRQKDYIF